METSKSNAATIEPVMPSTPLPPKLPDNVVDTSIEPASSADNSKTSIETIAVAPEESLSSENKNFFSRMSEGGREVAGTLLERFYNIPAINKVVGKIEIAYNQFWIDRHEGKASKFKDEADRTGVQIEGLDKAKTELESAIKDLAAKNIPGVGSLQLKIKVIDQQRTNLIDEMESARRKCEVRLDKANLYVTERDMVVDNLVGIYDKKLEPMDKKLEGLQTKKDQLDLLVASTSAKHEEQLAKLNDVEDKKKTIETALRRTGMTDAEISKFGAVKALAEYIESGREKVRDEKTSLSERMALINQKISKANEKASPYKEKRGRLVNLKNGKKIVVNKPNSRAGMSGSVGSETMLGDEDSVTDDGDVENLKEETHFKTKEFVDGWNNYLTQKDPAEKLRSGVDLASFLKVTDLSKDSMLDFKNFENILIKYYKFTKIHSPKLEAAIKSFIKEKQAVK